MKFEIAAHSDTGIKKQVNQDSLCVKIADTKKGQIVFAMVCDGMGGLRKGELASATVIRSFSGWFEKDLPYYIAEEKYLETTKRKWAELVEEANGKIFEYGSQNHIDLGTTAAGLLIAENRYLTVNVGDSRIYKIDSRLKQLTVDQTFLEMEVQGGRMTHEQAREDPRQNILLQCIGTSKPITADFTQGDSKEGEIYMLCSDGFRHKIQEGEILGVLNPLIINNQSIMKNSLIDMVELNKQRGETDNISVVAIRTV